jgi:hypothetical protein
MEIFCFSKTLASTYGSTRRQKPEQQHRRPHSRKNLKCGLPAHCLSCEALRVPTYEEYACAKMQLFFPQETLGLPFTLESSVYHLANRVPTTSLPAVTYRSLFLCGRIVTTKTDWYCNYTKLLRPCWNDDLV